MSDEDDIYDLDLDADSRGESLDGHEIQESIVTREGKYAALKRKIEARRAVDQWLEEKQLLMDLQNSDLFITCNRNELLSQIQ